MNKGRMKTEVETLCDLRKETCSPQDCRGVYVGLEHIDAGSFVLARHGTPSQVRSAKSRFYPGDVLYGKLRPYLDKAIVAEVEGICSTDILVLEPCGAPSWFLCGVLHTNRFIEHAKKTTQGVNHPRTSWSGIKDFETTAFPVSEQKKIAAVLLKIQRAIETQEKIIQSLRALKKSTMQHLFTHGLRGEKTKMTEIGEIPESWVVATCEDVAEKITVGIVVRPASYYVRDGVPAFRSLNVREDRLVSDDLVYISQVDNDTKLAKSKLCAGDILVVRTGYPGTSCVVPETYEGTNCIDLVIVRPKDERLLSHFLSRFFNSEAGKRHALAAKTGLAQQHLNVGAVRRARIPLPSLGEQTDITNALASMDSKLLYHESKRSAFQDLFKTALNKLMTGDIRIGDFDIDVKEVEG